jgi:radical SAM protein (TIGR01212 family)
VAYFQPSTNTNGPVEVLRELYRQAIDHPAVVGLIVGTRPDCVSDEVIRLLDELSREVWVSLELGLQTIHDRSLAWLGRGHDYGSFLDTVDRCRSTTFDLGAHVILGIPGESREEILATADELTRLEIDSVKLHNLYAVRNTPLAEMVQAGEFQFGTLQQYVNLVVAFLERLRSECVIDRLTGEAPPDYLVAPGWCLKKAVVIQRIEEALQVRQTWQGRFVEEGRAASD